MHSCFDLWFHCLYPIDPWLVICAYLNLHITMIIHWIHNIVFPNWFWRKCFLTFSLLQSISYIGTWGTRHHRTKGLHDLISISNTHTFCCWFYIIFFFNFLHFGPTGHGPHRSEVIIWSILLPPITMMIQAIYNHIYITGSSGENNLKVSSFSYMLNSGPLYPGPIICTMLNLHFTRKLSQTWLHFHCYFLIP